MQKADRSAGQLAGADHPIESACWLDTPEEIFVQRENAVNLAVV